MDSDKNQVHEQIEKRYEQFAQQVMATNEPLSVNVDGMAPKSERVANRLADQLYSEEELAALPTPAANASIGCGNPLALADVQPGEQVLDLGSGGGLDCFMAAKAVGVDGYVIGVDATQKMIELANRNKQKMAVQNVEFRLGQIEKLPVESDSIDLIISNCVIDVSPDKTAVFQEAYRVLRAGGRMSISDAVLVGEIPAGLRKNIDLWAGAVITPLITLAEMVRFIKEAGFVGVHVESLVSYGLENFAQLDEESKMVLTNGVEWSPLPNGTGLYSAAIWARKPD